jgi:predicted amidophosphoribosyltransferase
LHAFTEPRARHVELTVARRKTISAVPTCPRCCATALSLTALFCRHCGASLTEAGTDHTHTFIARVRSYFAWDAAARGEPPAPPQPRPEKYDDVSTPPMALSCPECGYAMSFGFRDVCRQCGARLVMVPRLLHWNHYEVYVAGPSAAAAALQVKAIKLAVLIAAFVLLAKACAQ